MTDSTSQLVRVLEEWREHLKLTNRQFSEEFLGRNETEWSMYRSGTREWPTDTFVRRARERAEQHGGAWPRLIDDAIKQDALARVA